MEGRLEIICTGIEGSGYIFFCSMDEDPKKKLKELTAGSGLERFEYKIVEIKRIPSGEDLR